MTGALETTKIGGNAVFAPDKFFDGQALADGSSADAATTSGEFLFAQTLGGIEIKLLANGAVATGAGETLVVTIVTADVSGGTFNNTLLTYTVPASTTIADGDTIVSYVAPSDVSELYTKVVVTSDFDATGLSVDGVVTIV